MSNGNIFTMIIYGLTYLLLRFDSSSDDCQYRISCMEDVESVDTGKPRSPGGGQTFFVQNHVIYI